MIKLKTKEKHNILTIDGVVSKFIYAEGLTPSITTNFASFAFQTIYFYEKVVIVDGVEEISKQVVKSSTGATRFEDSQGVPGIDSMFNLFGIDIIKGTSLKDGLINNFKSIFEGVIKNGNYFGLTASDWEVVL